MTTIDVLNLPPVKLDGFCSRRKPDELQETSRALDRYAAAAAFTSAYISARSSGLDHAEALKAANKAYRAVRKAMGYQTTYDIRV